MPTAVAYQDFETPFIVETDASVELGVLLVQKKEDGKVNSVHYASRTVTGQYSYYITSERDVLAAVLALKKFRVSLLSEKPFVAYPEHQALQTAFKKK